MIVSTAINFSLIYRGIKRLPVGDGRAWKVDDRTQALVGPGLAMPLIHLFCRYCVNN